jgi:hypothetical protein
MKRIIAIILATLMLVTACDLFPKEEDTTTPKPDMSRKFTPVTLASIEPEQVAGTFSGKIYLDTKFTISAGTITNGQISLELPELTDSQCRSMTNVRTGLAFTPNTGMYQNDWLYVKNNDITDTNTYRLHGTLPSGAILKFIYTTIDTTYSGTFSGTDPNEYTYNCMLKTGWNVCEWIATSTNKITCSKGLTETNPNSCKTWSIFKQ